MRVTQNNLPGAAIARDVDLTIPRRRAAAERPEVRGAPNPMSVAMSRPAQDVVVLSVSGEVDSCTVPRLRELLWHRLSSCARVVVLDLSAVTFCNSSALQLLERCRRRAEQREISFRVVPDRRGLLRRLLSIVDATERFALRPDAGSATRG